MGRSNFVVLMAHHSTKILILKFEFVRMFEMFHTVIFSSFVPAHAQAMNEYLEGKMLTEVGHRPKFVDGNCGP